MTALRIADALWKRRYVAASAVVISAALSLDAVIARYMNRKIARIAAGASQGVRVVAAPIARTAVRTTLLSLETMRSNTVASYRYMATTLLVFPFGTIFLADPGAGGQEAETRSRPPTA